MNNQGFTLTKLFIVIIIIGLIAIPVTSNIINGTKKLTAKDSGYAIIEAASLEVAIKKLPRPIIFTEENSLNYKGVKPLKMELKIDQKGKSEMHAYISGYCVVKKYDDSKIVIDEKKNKKEKCVIR